ncbi:hypothetical protein [Bdellovibrio reynosensis]|uniref:Uncharacterized protein n=1 Tax=Bdellovibrio reynosensis TaxID=2835041 RepID=A0ABY4C4C8_9BACT|nr:hypothetical protein [Bdellovibrio reynosensis]UOE99816.1 hypothetical protein MNR06_08920 [Bdellovibrio reynosensis]
MEMEQTRIPSGVPGWGADLPKANRPGVPRERKVDKEDNGARWQAMDRQQPHMKIHKSIERPALTPVFGTACPPKGLSGFLRDQAYKLGEDKVSRWMMLMLADRCDMVESGMDELIFGPPTQTEEERRKRKNTVYGVGAGLGIAALALILKSRKK